MKNLQKIALAIASFCLIGCSGMNDDRNNNFQEKPDTYVNDAWEVVKESLPTESDIQSYIQRFTSGPITDLTIDRYVTFAKLDEAVYLSGDDSTSYDFYPLIPNSPYFNKNKDSIDYQSGDIVFYVRYYFTYTQSNGYKSDDINEEFYVYRGDTKTCEEEGLHLNNYIGTFSYSHSYAVYQRLCDSIGNGFIKGKIGVINE